MVPFGRRKASSLVLDQWGLVVVVRLGVKVFGVQLPLLIHVTLGESVR